MEQSTDSSGRGVAALLCAPALAAGVLIATAGTAAAALPSGTTPVTVAEGAVHGGIDAGLTEAAGIAGTITSAATHKPITSAYVLAFDAAGHVVGLPSATDATGRYEVKALPASGTGYAICVNTFAASGGGVATGYLNQCYKNVAWSGAGVPAGVTRVKLATGERATGVNLALASGAAISGTVTSTAGAALNSVYVQLRNRATGARFFALTGKSGAYLAKSLPPTSKGYQVCFDGRGSTTPSPRGFLTSCYRNVGWNGGAMPSAATAVSVSAGRTHTGVGGRLSPAAAVAGKVTDSRTGAAVANATVAVLSGGGAYLSSAVTNSKGQYVVKGLATATADRVCVRPKRVSPTTGYDGRCFKNVAWSGGRLPSGTTAVAVKAGRTTGNVNLKPVRTVVKLGSIAGTITEKAGGQPLQYATVHVFTTSGGDAGSTTTDAAGHYKIGGLRASSTGYVVCSDAPTFSISVPMPPTGWAPRCYADAAWTGGTVPAGATKLPLAAGQNRTGVDITLHVGGGISGAVTAAGSPGTGVMSIVSVYTTDGHLVATGFSAPGDGAYTVNGLSPSATGYVVCFDGRYTGGSTSYLPECYADKPWSGN